MADFASEPLDSNPQATRGIPKAASGTALGLLQNEPKGGAGSHLYAAALDVASHHPAEPGQAERYNELAHAFATLLETIVRTTPPGPERSTAISRAREAKFWSSAAIAMEGR